ncbi:MULTISPECIES: DUF1828 domain-containing protein [unclassified Pyramidobacter]|uniref:DUF1828 domain-containing protein n=1 Tax=unclassified Pyramidobacter TaxID=2632171 RepID=UPI000EA3AC49|nr:DUF1828 domain-containing protein [Pyramidobacter sp. CG50-2]RKJ78822.1 DUF1828 domain-containing protein [Pyramidobacter sp. CG50-2]
MLSVHLEEDLRDRLKTAVTLEKRGLSDYQVLLPFTFPDGDALKIILKNDSDGSWELTDEGHTLMFLSYYDIDVESKGRREFADKVLRSHSIEDRRGRLVMPSIPEDELAPAVFTYAQGLLKIGDLSMWKKERKAREFVQKFRDAVSLATGKRETVFDYFDRENDPRGVYLVDSLVTLTNRRGLYIYGINSEDRANRAAISIYHYEKLAPSTLSCVIYGADLGMKTRCRVDDAADKTLSSLEVVPERLEQYMKKLEAA